MPVYSPLARRIVPGVLRSFMTFGVLKRLEFAFKMILFPLPVCQGNNSKRTFLLHDHKILFILYPVVLLLRLKGSFSSALPFDRETSLAFCFVS